MPGRVSRKVSSNMRVKFAASLYMGEHFVSMLCKIMSKGAGAELYQYEDKKD